MCAIPLNLYYLAFDAAVTKKHSHRGNWSIKDCCIAESRQSIAKKFSGLQNMCAYHINFFLAPKIYSSNIPIRQFLSQGSLSKCNQ